MSVHQNVLIKENAIVPHEKSNRIKYLNIDNDTRHFSSVLIGRQIMRSSLLVGALSPIVLPFVAPLVDVSRFGRDAPADLMHTVVIMATPLLTLFLTISFIFYVKMYRGSRGALQVLRITTKIGRLVLYSLYLWFLVPLVALFYIRNDPLIIVYACAFAISISVLIYFARWMLKCVSDLNEAYSCVSAPTIFASPGEGNTLSFILRETFSLPPGYLIRPANAAWVVLLGTIALILEGFSFYYIWEMSQNLSNNARFDLPNMATLTNGSLDSRAEMLFASVEIAVFPLLSVPIFAAAGRLRRAARRAAVHSVSEVRAKDTRAPFVFLRSFHNDQVSLHIEKKINIFQRLTALGSLFSNIDELLTERFWHIGPVFAIGKPGDPLPPLGAARAYLVGEDWHKVVAERARDFIGAGPH